MGGSVDILLTDLDFMEDMWILSDSLDVMLLKYDGENKYLFSMLNLYDKKNL